MPIRINLLAAEQAAEDLRRRDPIKRAIFGGCALVALMIGWICITQLQVRAARNDLTEQTNRLAKLEVSSKQVRNSQVAALDGHSRLKALEQYSANRFFWGSFLDALQKVAVDNVRLTDVRSDQRHASADANKFFTTNVIVTYTPPPAGWKFWAPAKELPAIETLVSNMLANITNAAPFTTNTLKYAMKVTEVSTNASVNEITTLVEFSTVPWASENITIEIRGRDYGTPPGPAIDEFTKRLSSSPFFKQIVTPGTGLRFTERPPQPRPDPQDKLNPNALFVPFTIELVLDKRLFTKDETL
jgi:hypothetical protein